MNPYNQITEICKLKNFFIFKVYIYFYVLVANFIVLFNEFSDLLPNNQGIKPQVLNI